MARCECDHPESFHPKKKDGEKRSGLQGFADGIEAAFGGPKREAPRACLGELPSGKPCPCTRFIKKE